MRMPNGEKAIVAIEKLSGYCLNLDHKDGRHKARVFAAALNLMSRDAEWLQKKLLEAAASENAVLFETDEFGARYMVRFLLEHKGRRAIIRSLWIIKHHEDFPRLNSCYVEKKG